MAIHQLCKCMMLVLYKTKEMIRQQSLDSKYNTVSHSWAFLVEEASQSQSRYLIHKLFYSIATNIYYLFL